jgi:hypothetical protein
MPTHSNECSSLTKIRAHDIDQRVKFNSRAVNEIEKLIRGSQLKLEARMFLATKVLGRDEFAFGGNTYVKTITRSFAGSGVHLRDSERAGSAAHSSTHFNPTGQRDDERPDSSLASESTSGVGIRSQWHIYRHH